MDWVARDKSLRPALKPLFGEIGDLKRVRSAARTGSVASRLFASAWAALVGGDDALTVGLTITAAALRAVKLGDIDGTFLAEAGVGPEEARAILQAAVSEAAAEIPPELRAALVDLAAAPPAASTRVPNFVAALARQPRAGVTCPGRPRIVLEPAETHADHCLVVAVIGVLLAPVYGAAPGTVFLAALAHHLHNAGLPDSGYAGEILLGVHLRPVMEHFTVKALATLPASLRRQVEAARRILPDAETPEGQAFHAADTIDRVLEIGQHLRAATLTMDEVLTQMGLVHAGPVKPFQDRVLAEMGLS